MAPTTTSSILLDTLEQAGITHVFVNLGSDHPALLEAFVERLRTRNGNVTFVTSPNESVALNCAQGYYQACGKPAAVIVHVDCGTQALAGAIHNVAVCRVPVFIFAGASPFTQEGELLGSRNEFIHWLQNVPDQPAIVRQYMKHVAEIRTGRNAQQVILRSLQFAMTEPRGPVYCWAPREITEEHVDPTTLAKMDLRQWQGADPLALSNPTLANILETLKTAKSPLIVTSYVGRNPLAVPVLAALSDFLAIPVWSSCPSTLNIPFDHPMHAGLAFSGTNTFVEKADWILVIDSDVPWIPLFTKPRPDANIIHIDCDVLKSGMSLFYIPAQIRANADAKVALEQILEAVQAEEGEFNRQEIERRREEMSIHRLKEDGTLRQPNGGAVQNGITHSVLPLVPHIIQSLRKHAPKKHLLLNESISNYPLVWDNFRPTEPGSLISSGASSLGWGIGAAIGAILAGMADPSKARELTTLIVGDGSFIFGVPSAAYWMARRYDTPFLTIVLNNGGWKSPRLSLLGVHPTGPASLADPVDLNISFGPDSPDFGGLAAAAGGAWSRKVQKDSQVDDAIREAIDVVCKERRCALLEFYLEKFGPSAR